MKCKEYEEDRVLYAYGELRGKKKRMFEEHLYSCPYCKKYLKEFKGIISIYDDIPRKEPSERTVKRILKRAGRIRKPTPVRKRIFIRWRVRWAVPAFACAVGVLLLLILPRIRKDELQYTFEDSIWNINQQICLMTNNVILDDDIDSRIQGIVSELSFLECEW